jgi:DNA repair protein RecO (recombination protein O)
VLERRRVEAEQAFVLHTYPYSETSLLVEAYSRSHGRLPLLAKGARRPRSNMRGLLMAFQPLLLGWSGRGEVRSLNRCEWVGGHALLSGDALLCGFYMNELLLRLMPREDAHEALFDRYVEATAQLANGEPHARVLRSFERTLLKELGYAITFDREAVSGQALEAEGLYRYELDKGPVQHIDPDGAPGLLVFRGKTLLDIAQEDYSDPATLQQCKQLMRMLINHRLEQRPLYSRNVFMDLQQL